MLRLPGLAGSQETRPSRIGLPAVGVFVSPEDSAQALRTVTTQCLIEFERNGSVTTFSTGDGSIDSAVEFIAVNGLPGNVKVVKEINWCGSLVPGILGCAPIPGNSFVVVRTSENTEGIVWLHEFGHNKGLPHRNVAHAIMRSFVGLTHRRMNAVECLAYRVK